MSEAESELRTHRRHRVTVDDIRELTGASTPHFALQIRDRIARLIADLEQDDPARIEGQRAMHRLETISTQAPHVISSPRTGT